MVSMPNRLKYCCFKISVSTLEFQQRLSDSVVCSYISLALPAFLLKPFHRRMAIHTKVSLFFSDSTNG